MRHAADFYAPHTGPWQPHPLAAQMQGLEAEALFLQQQQQHHFAASASASASPCAPRKRKFAGPFGGSGDDEEEEDGENADAMDWMRATKRPCIRRDNSLDLPAPAPAPAPAPGWGRCPRKRKASEELFNDRMAGLHLAREADDAVFGGSAAGPAPANHPLYYGDAALRDSPDTTHVLVPRRKRARLGGVRAGDEGGDTSGASGEEEFELVDKRLIEPWAIVLRDMTQDAPAAPVGSDLDPQSLVLYRAPESYIADIWRRRRADELAAATAPDAPYMIQPRPVLPRGYYPQVALPDEVVQPFLAELTDDDAVRAFLDPTGAGAYGGGAMNCD